jgi:hypothetical protein
VYSDAKHRSLLSVGSFGLLPDIAVNLFFGEPGAGAPDKVTLDPDLPTPVLPLEFRVVSKERLGTEGFEDLRGPRGSNPWRGGQGKVNMVGEQVYGADLHVVLFGDRAEQALHFCSLLFVFPDPFAILRAPGEVIPQIIAGMAGGTYGHKTYQRIRWAPVPQPLAAPSESPMPEHR